MTTTISSNHSLLCFMKQQSLLSANVIISNFRLMRSANLISLQLQSIRLGGFWPARKRLSATLGFVYSLALQSPTPHLVRINHIFQCDHRLIHSTARPVTSSTFSSTRSRH